MERQGFIGRTLSRMTNAVSPRTRWWDGSKYYRGRMGLRDLERQVKHWHRRYGATKAATYGVIYGGANDAQIAAAGELRHAAAESLRLAKLLVSMRRLECGLPAK